MTQDDQNKIDLRRMAEMRARALDLLDDFREWQSMDATKVGNQIIIIGLQRDILRGTEDELDRLISEMEDRNNQSLMKKMSKGC